MTEKFDTVAETTPTQTTSEESSRLLQKPEAMTAGGKLRAAREAAGVDIAVLAAALKVPVQKLEALEGDHYDLLPDIAFTRGLAQSICRRFKVDPATVLALLPELPTRRVPREGLNAPFDAKDSHGSSLRGSSGGGGRHFRMSWLIVIAVILVLAAIALFFVPSSLLSQLRGVNTSETSSSLSSSDTGSNEGTSDAAAVPVQANDPGSSVTQAPDVTPEPSAAPSASDAGATPAVAAAAVPATAPAATPADLAKPLVEANANVSGGVITFAASAESWIDVRSPAGNVLATRRLRSGETLNLPNVAPPFRVVVGNARATVVTLRGQPYDLKPFERGNVARFEVN